MSGTTIAPIVDEGLGNSAYLVDLGGGRALAVDAPRDLRAVRAAAGRLGLSVAFAADTHLHADFQSGARQLAADFGAQILASAAGGRAFQHLRLAEGNRRGPDIIRSGPALASLTADQVREMAGAGAQVIDVRQVADYAAGHIPGSLAIPLRGAFATWLGWLVPDPVTPLIIIASPDQDLSEVTWQALKIGYQNLAGTLAGGLPAWQAAGQPVAVTALLPPARIDPARVIDVRQADEYAAGHLPGGRNIRLGAISRDATGFGSEPVVTMCRHSERAAMAAILLGRAGHPAVAVAGGGPADWSAATGLPVAVTA